MAFETAGGATYRFAPNWYAGLEVHYRTECPQFDCDKFEHRVLYAGPSIH
jgi:hypothetical protein